MRIFLLLFLLFFSCQAAVASSTRLYVGTSWLYANVNEPKYNFVNENEAVKNPKQAINSAYIGVAHYFDNDFNICLQTNRFFNSAVERSVEAKSNHLTFKNKTRLTTDTILIGKRFNRFTPSFLISNSSAEKKLFYKNSLVGKETKTTILYGVNLGYFITRNIVGSVFYIAPNSEFNLESAGGLSLNYIF